MTAGLPPIDLTDRELRQELATAEGDRAAALQRERAVRKTASKLCPPLHIGFPGAGKSLNDL